MKEKGSHTREYTHTHMGIHEVRSNQTGCCSSKQKIKVVLRKNIDRNNKYKENEAVGKPKLLINGRNQG
jgi:hypothetical protein